MKLVATTEVYYASKTRRPGDEFEASDSDAMLLKGIGKAVDAPKPVVTKAVEPVQVETPPKPVDPAESAEKQSLFTESGEGTEAPKPKRRYQRRDLAAEDPSNG